MNNIDEDFKAIKNEYFRFQKAFNYFEERPRIDKKDVWLYRVFCYAMKISGHSMTQTARAVKKDRSTLLYHLNNISEDEIKLAKMFLQDYSYNYNDKKKNLWYGAKR